jgi:fibro-slime domain-containing protein/LPXTG-motif cell wall-anchored protein
MRPFAKRFIALSLCAGLVLTGTGGTTASQVDINEISMEAASLDSETSTEATVQADTETPTSGDAQESKTDAESGTNANAGTADTESGTNADVGTTGADSGTDADAGTTGADSGTDANAGAAGTQSNADSNIDADDADAQNPTANQEELKENEIELEDDTELEEEKPEEKLQTLTYTDGTVYVSVRAEEGVIPDNASLRVVPIVENADETASSSEEKSEDKSSETASASKIEASETTTQEDVANSKTYEEVAAELEKDATENDYELLGFLAYDISFIDENGAEVEPYGDVTVTMKYESPVLPESVANAENAENAEVSIMHLDETGSEINVADLTKTANIQTNQQGVWSTQFTSGSFSTFTITWKSYTGEAITVQYVYVDKTSMDIDVDSEDVILKDGEELVFADYAKTIAKSGNGYKYSKATVGSYAGSQVTSAKLENGTITYYNGDTSVSSSDTSVFLIYQDSTSATIETADTSDNVTINLFDYVTHPTNTTENSGSDSNGTGYDSGINEGHSLKFSNGQNIYENTGSGWNQTKTLKYSPMQGLQAWGTNSITQGIVQNKLLNGYPVLAKWAGTTTESLDYLFDENTSNTSRKDYTGLNYLFSYDEETGEYSYDSGQFTKDTSQSWSNPTYTYSETGNFATIAGNDSTNKNFTVYENSRAGFLPFTTYDNAYDNSASSSGNALGSSEINHYFGMNIVTDFVQPAGGLVNGEAMEFEFSGDDDVWVFIDGVLVLDLGGIHAAIKGTINFADGTVSISQAYDNAYAGVAKIEYDQNFETNGTYSVSSPSTDEAATTYSLEKAFRAAYGIDETEAGDKLLEQYLKEDSNGNWVFADNTTHTMSFFYLERGCDSSNCSIKFNLQTLPKGSLVASKTVTGVDENDDSEYMFILKDKDSNPVKDAEYTIYGGGNSSSGVTGKTDSDGVFYLKNGQYAVFKDLDPGNYTVKEDGIKEETGTYPLSDFYTYATYYDSDGNLISQLVSDENKIEKDQLYSATVTVSSSKTASVSFLNTLKPENDRTLEKRKYISAKNDDGTYDLTLEFSGKVGTRVDEATDEINADVVIVMGASSEEREMVQSIAKHLAGLHPLVETSFAVVSLDTGEVVTQTGENLTSNGWTKVYSKNQATNEKETGGVVSIDLPPENNSSSGSANYDTALKTAAELLRNGNGETTNAQKVLIIVSDDTITDLQDSQETLSGLDDNLDFVYAVGYGQSGDSTLENLVKNYSPISALESYYDATGSATTEIVKAIGNSLSGIYCSNVTVEDTLSQYAQWTDEISLTLTVYDEKGQAIAGSEDLDSDITDTTVIAQTSASIRQEKITASLKKVDGERKIIVTFPENYKLPKGYKYSVTVKIEPTEQAYQDYINNNYSYPDVNGVTVVGGKNTGDTSEDQEGFVSNDSAFVSYIFGDATDPTKEYYEVPVIQLQTIYDWTIFKVSSTNSNLKLAGAEFTLTRIADADGTPVNNGTIYYGTSADEPSAGTATAAGTGEIVWYHSQSKTNKMDYIPSGTYTLTETKAPAGYYVSDVKWTVKVDYKNGIKITTTDDVEVTPVDGTSTLESAATSVADGSVKVWTIAYNFEDNVMEYNLPSAGGMGIFLFVIAGMLLMMGGALLIFAKRRRVLRI